MHALRCLMLDVPSDALQKYYKKGSKSMRNKNSNIEYWRHRWLWAPVLGIAILSLTSMGCAGRNKQQTETGFGDLSGYNHTADYIHQFYVDGKWGGNVYPYRGGGSFVCCYRYPEKWREGLKATVRWTTSSADPKATGDAATEKWHEATVPIERYLEPGTVNVHFLPEGKVRLVISNFSARHPEYPGPARPEKPKSFER